MNSKPKECINSGCNVVMYVSKHMHVRQLQCDSCIARRRRRLAIEDHVVKTYQEYEIFHEYYPPDSRGRRTVFAQRYFAYFGYQLREIAYWLPDVGTGMIFDTPRQWADSPHEVLV